jgi:cobalt-zinc-cadmium efflux system membrane fusion protein
MAYLAARRLRDAWTIVGFAAAAIGVVLLAWIVVQANRPSNIRDQKSTVDVRVPSTDGYAAVGVERTDLGAAAGIQVEGARLLPMEESISCYGSASFNLNKYVMVPPRADGILRKIAVDVGSKVRSGDELAIVDSQTMGDLKASYIKSLVHEEHLRWQLESFKAAGQGIATKNVLEAQHLLEEQLTDTARLKDRLDNFGLSPAQIETIVKTKDVSVRLSVLAPRDGVVVDRKAVEGQAVQTTSMLFAIADLDTMWVQLNVYERHLNQIRLGQRVEFFPDGLPGQAFHGQVTWVSPEVNHETRTIQLRTEVANRDGVLRANMFGRGELPAAEPRQRLVVPRSAVQSHQGGHIVFVQKPDGLFEARKIEIGLKNEQFWEIAAGLERGEMVATSGSFLLKSNLENPEFGRKVD